MAWEDIKTALIEMFEGDEFIVKYNSKLSRDIDLYLFIDDGDEKNVDANNYVGTNQYRNIKQFDILVYNKSTYAQSSDIDIVRNNCKAELGSVLSSIKLLVSNVYNATGDAGAIRLQYLGCKFEDIEQGGLYSPLRLRINMECEYTESRGITL